MKINEDEAHLRVEIGSGGQMTAQIEPKRKIDVLIGDAAKMDCQRAINYIRSGTAEIDKAVEDGIEKIGQKVEGMANVDLSNLSFLGRAKFDAKQDAISDLATIREGAALGATAVQPSALATVATTGEYSDLSGTPTLAAVATSGSYDDLLDKPNIPAAQVNSDWNATSGVAQILNKPSLATVATSGAYADLSGTPDLSAKANTDLSNLTTTGKSYGASLALPSDNWVDLTIGASGATYTAPANGYFACRNQSAQTYLSIKNMNSTVVENEQMASWLPINGNSCYIPVKKGQTVQLNYSANSFFYFRFVYAEGEI